MTAQDYNVPALSAQDQNCKEHDIALYEATTDEDVDKAHEEFYVSSAGTLEGRIQSNLVHMFGPSEPNSAKRKRKHLRREHLQKSKKAHTSMTQSGWWSDSHGNSHPSGPGTQTGPGTLPGPADPGMPRGGQQQPQGPQTQTASVSAAVVSGRGHTNKQGETPVDKLPTLSYLPFKHTQQCYMKFRHLGTLTAASGSTSTSCATATYRLNSIYDVYSTYGFVADPTAVAETADATINTPHMRAYWMNFYRYWTVTRTHYKLKTWTTTTSNTGEIVVYLYKHGQQHPPIRNYTTDTRIEHFVRKNHPNVSYHKLYTPNTTETDFNLFEDKVDIRTGVWTPGSISNTIAEDEFSETWHKATEVPSDRQLMTIMVQRSERAEDKEYVVKYELEMVFEVQLKDVKAEHEFVTNDSAIPAIAGYYAQQN